MIDLLSFGNRVEIGPGSVVLVSLETDDMREFPTLDAALLWVLRKNLKEFEK